MLPESVPAQPAPWRIRVRWVVPVSLERGDQLVDGVDTGLIDIMSTTSDQTRRGSAASGPSMRRGYCDSNDTPASIVQPVVGKVGARSRYQLDPAPVEVSSSYFFLGLCTTVVRGLRAAVDFFTKRPVIALRACPLLATMHLLS